MAYKITEETIEQEVAESLKAGLGADVLSQVRIAGTNKKPDLIVSVGPWEILIEGKIGSARDLTGRAILQVSEYKEKAGAHGFMVLIYPPLVRQYVRSGEDVREIVQTVPFYLYCLTPFLKEDFPEITLPELITVLHQKLSRPERTPPLGKVVSALGDAVRALSAQLKRFRSPAQKVVDQVVGNFRLFRILSEVEGKDDEDEETKAELESVACDLACYIIINQLLLHRLLSDTLNLEPIAQLERMSDLSRAFEKIRSIDYKAIYNIQVADKFPHSAVRELNQIISLLDVLEPELVPSDLLGRVFHEFLPFETRKQLGAFYTKPVAAEILAHIGIPEGARQVMDPACGTGTLLVAAYRRLKHSSPRLTHHKLVEELLTGIDIMPFAAHMTALNLTLQSVEETTDRTRIGLFNSLKLSRTASVPVIGRDGLLDLETHLEGVGPDVTPESLPFQMPLAVDTVIMNPPFTRKQRIKGDMWGNYQSAFAASQHYWAYFIAFADSMLRAGGTISAVLPRDFVKGEYSAEVRKWLFLKAGYSAKYLVKSLREVSFSENAAFRDYMIVLQKGPCSCCGVVYLKAGLAELRLESAWELGDRISSVPEGLSVSNDDFAIDWIPQSEVLSNAADLWPLIGFSSPQNGRAVHSFISKNIRTHHAVTSLSSLPTNIIKGIIEGWKIRPLGMRDALFLVRPIDAKRLHPKSILLLRETEKYVEIQTPMSIASGESYKINKESFLPALRTHSYVPCMNVNDYSDYFAVREYKGMAEVSKLLGGKQIEFGRLQRAVDTRITHLAIVRRLNVSAPGVSMLAFYSDTPMMVPDTFNCVQSNQKDYLRALCLWLNSIAGVVQILIRRTETEGSYCNLEQKQLPRLLVPEPSSDLADTLSKCFIKFGHVAFPSLLEQFAGQQKDRVLMDIEVLRSLGHSNAQAQTIVNELYPVIVNELTQMKESMASR